MGNPDLIATFQMVAVANISYSTRWGLPSKGLSDVTGTIADTTCIKIVKLSRIVTPGRLFFEITSK